jgi:choice-of-anchor B domain-containing protein
MRTPIKWRDLAPLALLLVLVLVTATAVGANVNSGPNDGKSKAGLTADVIQAMPMAGTPALGPAECVDGLAGVFPCENVDLASFVPMAELGGVNGSDIWGWEDQKTGREYAIMTTGEGTGFVDVTDPTAPVVVGILPTDDVGDDLLWRDVKVNNGHAYIVSEIGNHGMQVFNLKRLRGAGGDAPTIFDSDFVYEEFGNAHNISINTKTNFAYAIGTGTCNGGLHMIDLSDAANPTFVGCAGEDGYTHDVECVRYRGQDGRFRGDEICFASNEDTLTIIDVTDKTNPVVLSRSPYPSAAYTHQGSLTGNQRFFVFGDELDELLGTVPSTTTYIARVKKLDEPLDIQAFVHDTLTIDHNLYVQKGRKIFMANYVEGLQIFEFTNRSLRDGDMERVAYFDVVPGVDGPTYGGSWSSYRFRSGTTVVSTIESGLFVLQPNV